MRLLYFLAIWSNTSLSKLQLVYIQLVYIQLVYMQLVYYPFGLLSIWSNVQLV